MLSVFPIHYLALLAYFILRVCVGFVLLYLCVNHFSYRHELQHILRLSWWPWGKTTAFLFAGGEGILACLLLVGAWTQVAALLVAAMSLKMMLLRHRFAHHTIPNKLFYLLLFGASLSLVITGAGVFAVDLPL
jgi:uncharacterized membrane protein YphA (DoxX/SURF4 family)